MMTDEQIVEGLKALGRLDLVYHEYPRLSEARTVLDHFCILMSAASESKIAVVYGDSGVGKSAFLQHVFGQFETGGFNCAEGVLYVELPGTSTTRAVAQKILKALGDPCASKGTVFEMMDRLVDFLRDKGIKVIILDEFQHLIDKETKKVRASAADWVKELLERTCVAVIVAGLPGLMRVVMENEQLHRRVLVSFELESWPYSRIQDREKFQEQLFHFAAALPFTNAGLIALEVFASMMHRASRGRLGLVVKLLKRAGMISLQRHSETLDSNDFYSAFAEFSKDPEKKDFHGVLNPFCDGGSLHGVSE